jgi:hypothetical protein
MRLAESRNLPKTPPQEDPLQFLENYRLGG